MDILMQYPNLTKPNLLPSGVKHNTVHYITTKGKPVFSKPRQLDAKKLKLAKEEFQYMLQNGIIRPSKSEWASPLHLAAKKDGTLRPCGDFRRLNEQTIPDRYPLPRIDDFQNILYKKKCFSKLDLFKAYFQIPVAEEDRAKTAITTPFGLFEFNVMPFGLRNAPASFQRFINEIFAGLNFVFAYIDDCLVASETEDEHKKHLELVFERLDQYGLRINLSKSTLGVDKLEFLGYEITPEGSRPLPDKVNSIINYKLPQTVRGLRMFLGMLNFYRRYLKNAAENQAPLHEFLKGAKKNDKNKIPWTPETIEKFELCKSDLANAAMLTFPGPDFPLALVVDASDYAIGSVVQQLDENGWKPLAFYSKKLNTAQRSYSTYDRELLSMYLSVKNFKHLLEGREFAIYTDHKPLTFAFRQKNEKASPRQQRQLLYVSEFTTDIRHISGKHNVVADTLSRIEEVNTIDFDKIADAQQEDVDLKYLKENNTSLTMKSQQLPSGKELWCDISTGNIRPFIPLTFRKAVYSLIHNFAHPGIKSTVKQVTSRYVWPNMKKDVQEWAKCCIDCQKSKVHRHIHSPVGSFTAPDERFADVHIDLVGPLPPSEGNTFLLTCIDRFTNWVEAIPLENTTAETVAKNFYAHWIARFGAPVRITTDQGRQFESHLFKNFSALCGVKVYHTTPYHPQCNGKIERFHRTLKAALKAHSSVKWTTVLPTILLGLRAAINPETKISTSQMVYGKTIKLPGEFLGEPTNPITDPVGFVEDLQSCMRQIKPVAVLQKNQRNIFIYKNLAESTHVFVRIDRVKKPLEPAYEGPFPVQQRFEKYYTLKINGKPTNISVDRIKPAYLLKDEPTSESINNDRCPAKSPMKDAHELPVHNNEEPRQQQNGIQPQTRSGRRVRFPVRFLQ